MTDKIAEAAARREQWIIEQKMKRRIDDIEIAERCAYHENEAPARARAHLYEQLDLQGDLPFPKKFWIENATRYISLDSAPNRYDDGRDVPNATLRIAGTYKRANISYVAKGFSARQETGERKVPGPWAATYGLGTMLTAARVAREPEIEVEDGDVLSIDGIDFRVRVYRREYIALDRIESDGHLTPAGWRF